MARLKIKEVVSVLEGMELTKVERKLLECEKILIKSRMFSLRKEGIEGVKRLERSIALRTFIQYITYSKIKN